MQQFTRIIFTFLITTLLFAYKKHSITTGLTGHLQNGKNSHEVLSKLNVILKSNGRIVGSAITDKRGNFNLEFNTTSEDSVFRFYCYRKGTAMLLLKTVRWFESDTPEITFYLPSDFSTFQKKVNRATDKNR